MKPNNWNTEYINTVFSHEKLDVYQVSLEFVSWSYKLSKQLKGSDRHAKDQLIRASQSIPLNIAEGNGKRSIADRSRFFQFSCGSALECSAILDVLLKCEVIAKGEVKLGKNLLLRIVAMLTKMTNTTNNQVKEERLNYKTKQSEYEI